VEIPKNICGITTEFLWNYNRFTVEIPWNYFPNPLWNELGAGW